MGKFNAADNLEEQPPPRSVSKLSLFRIKFTREECIKVPIPQQDISSKALGV